MDACVRSRTTRRVALCKDAWLVSSRRASVPVKARRIALCRGGPMCPLVLVRALYAIWADTQVRPYNIVTRLVISNRYE